MSYIDNFLNSITMYRLVLMGLTLLSILGIILAFFGFFPFTGISAIVSAAILLAVCRFSNLLFGRLLKVPLNVESDYISAFILFLVLTPPASLKEAGVIVLAGVLAMASKYIFNFRGKHVFNPVAISLVLMGLAGFGIGSWWVASAVMLPATLIAAFLVVRKIRRADLFFAFILIAFAACLITGYRFGLTPLEMSQQVLLSWPLVFFGSIMLTEPQTTPPTRKLRIIYAVFVGILFGTAFNIGPIHNTPELALALGNILSYFLSPKGKLILTLKQKIQLAPGIYDFIFGHEGRFAFAPGQYLEWTLAHPKSDMRGVRRYFTIASSPTENEVRLGAKFYEPSSTFKKKLLAMAPGETITASQLSGDFTLPPDKSEKLAFIAGGIGVTPFRSMTKYLVDKNEKRDVVLFYSTKTPEEAVYKDVFDQAQDRLGTKVVYAGMVTEEMLKTEAPDYLERTFYISGPHVMVDAFKKTLSKMGVKKSRIKTDFFPGYA